MVTHNGTLGEPCTVLLFVVMQPRITIIRGQWHTCTKWCLKFPNPAVATFIKRCNGLNATECGHTTPMPHGASPIMYPLMVQQETGAPTTPPSSNIGWTLCQQGMCVCDTAVARCSNISREKKAKCSLLPFPHSQRPCSSNYRDQPDSPPVKMRTMHAVGSEMILPLMHTALLCSLSHQKGA